MPDEQTALTPQQSFEQKLTDRIRESIGDLMPDEKLAEIVQRGMEEAFFKERTVERRYGDRVQEPSWAVVVVKELLDEKVKGEVSKWFVEHPDEIEKIIKDVIGKGIVNCAISYLESKLFFRIQNAVQETLQQMSNR